MAADPAGWGAVDFRHRRAVSYQRGTGPAPIHAGRFRPHARRRCMGSRRLLPVYRVLHPRRRVSRQHDRTQEGSAGGRSRRLHRTVRHLPRRALLGTRPVQADGGIRQRADRPQPEPAHRQQLRAGEARAGARRHRAGAGHRHPAEHSCSGAFGGHTGLALPVPPDRLDVRGAIRGAYSRSYANRQLSSRCAARCGDWTTGGSS